MNAQDLKNFELLRELLRTQDECYTQTPLYCLMERDSPEQPEDGSGRLATVFLTEQGARAYMDAIGYRLSRPYIWVRGPGEASELHAALRWIREGELAPAGQNAPGFFVAVAAEITKARELHPPYTCLHHGYAILLEETEEFWDEVKKKGPQRDLRKAYAELVQVATVAMRIAEEVIAPRLQEQAGEEVAA